MDSFPSRPSFMKGGVTNRSNSTSISSGLGSSISNNNTSSPPSYSRMVPSSVGANRNATVHSNSPKFVNATALKNDVKQSQPVATRSASVPSGASALKHQQRSLPAPPGEIKVEDDNEARDRGRIQPSFYHNRGDYLNFFQRSQLFYVKPFQFVFLC